MLMAWRRKGPGHHQQQYWLCLSNVTVSAEEGLKTFNFHAVFMQLRICCVHVATLLWTTAYWKRHQMESFSALLAFGAGNSPVAGEFPPHFDFSLMWVCMSLYTNSRMTGDFRLHDSYVTSS